MSQVAYTDEVYDYVVHYLEGLGATKDHRGQRAGAAAESILIALAVLKSGEGWLSSRISIGIP